MNSKWHQLHRQTDRQTDRDRASRQTDRHRQTEHAAELGDSLLSRT